MLFRVLNTCNSNHTKIPFRHFHRGYEIRKKGAKGDGETREERVCNYKSRIPLQDFLLFPTTTQGLIEINNSLYFIEPVGYLRQLGREQGLLCGKYFQIGGITMPHQ